MAAITGVNINQDGSFVATISTLTASDTITYQPNQYILFQNDTVGSLTALIDGDGATSQQVAGIGSVDTSSGVSVVVPAGSTKILNVNSRSAFFKGVVTISGAAGLKVIVMNA